MKRSNEKKRKKEKEKQAEKEKKRKEKKGKEKKETEKERGIGKGIGIETAIGSVREIGIMRTEEEITEEEIEIERGKETGIGTGEEGILIEGIVMIERGREMRKDKLNVKHCTKIKIR